jgi:monofunctional glycosyltransferase
MAEAWVGAISAGRSGFYLQQTSLPLAAISPNLALAVIAAEDQHFPHHHGFDLEQVAAALRESRAGSMRGASTLSQQTIKNLLLWPGRSWVRKGLEAWYTFWLEVFCSKKRILELYLNFAEFGDGIYGARAANRVYFKKTAAQLSAEEAALLAAVLPNPRHLQVANPSAHVRARQHWILRQMRQLGGVAYLREM